MTKGTFPLRAVVMSFNELERHSEYSCSQPTGVYARKCWSRNRTAYVKPGKDGKKPQPDWWMATFVELPTNDPKADEEMLIWWFKVYLGEWSSEVPTIPGVYLVRSTIHRHEVYVDKDETIYMKQLPAPAGMASYAVLKGKMGGPLWAETPDEDPDGDPDDRYWCNYEADALEDVEWFCVQRQCNHGGCERLCEGGGFEVCRSCIEAWLRTSL